MPYDVDARVDRALKQKLFLINSEMVTDTDATFDVMGTTGNVYTVEFGSDHTTCNCPDFALRGRRCKHIFFTLLKVMRADVSWAYKDEFGDDELILLFQQLANIPTVAVASKVSIDRYKMLKSGDSGGLTMSGVDDDCLICMDELQNGDLLIHCKYGCGKPVHRECFDYYTKQHTRKCLTCGKSMDPPHMEGGYINVT